MGQVFARASYKVTFIDIDERLISALNAKGEYVVETVFNDAVELIPIKGVNAINANDQEAVNQAIGNCALMGVSVGKNGWPHIAKQLATAINDVTKLTKCSARYHLAENIQNGAAFVTSSFQYLPPDSHSRVCGAN